MSTDSISTQVFEEVFSAIPFEFLVFNAENLKLRHVNARAQKNLQYPLSEFMSMTLADIQPGIEKASLDGKLRDGVDSEAMKSTHFSATHRRRDGTNYDVEVIMLRIKEAPLEYLAFAFETASLHNPNKRVSAEQVNIGHL